MDEALKQRLLVLGLTGDHVAKLAEAGVANESHMAMLSAAEIREVTGCQLIPAKMVQAAFAPAVAETTPTVLSPEVSVAPDAVIPEGTNPSPAQVNAFAASLGMSDPSMLMMLMMGGMAGGAGVDMDLSGMIPIPQIVAGYNPKLRNMNLMIMGQVERRLNTPIVVINADGSVNPDLTVKHVMSLEEGFDAPSDNVYYDDAGVPYEIIRVGVDAQSIYDADPLDSSKAIPKSGIGVGRVNWNHVSLEVRQVVYLAVKNGEVSAANESNVSWLRDHISPTATRLSLRGQCPKALSDYNEAARTGSLPTLRVMLGRGPRRPEVMPRRRRTNPSDLTGLGRTHNEEVGASRENDPFYSDTSRPS